jgi:aldose sugar dehydrogenase
MPALAVAMMAGVVACSRPPAPGPGVTTTTQGGSTPGAPRFGPATQVAGGLVVPWSLAFPDDRHIIVSERPGRIRLVRDGQLQAQPIGTVPARASGEGGLMGIALHPQFPQQRFLYAYYTGANGNRLVRLSVGADFQLSGEQVLIPGIPDGIFHDGGHIAFGPDGMLYVASGDGTNPASASDRSSLNGKILRVTPDGRVPADNPFPGSYVWSWGHRNPQGFAWDRDGRMYATEHGPTVERAGLCCWDELNLIQRGGYYGWPYRAGTATTGLIAGQPPATPIDPIASSGASGTWAPANLALIDGSDGNTYLYSSNLRGANVLRFTVSRSAPATVRAQTVELTGHGRYRAGFIGPDGCHYVTTSNRDSRGTPRAGDDQLLKRCPV